MIKVEDFLTPEQVRKNLKYSVSANEMGIGDALYFNSITGELITAENGPDLINKMEGYVDEDNVKHLAESPLVSDYDIMSEYERSKDAKGDSNLFVFKEGRPTKVQEEYTKLCFYANHVPVEQRLQYRKVIAEAIANPFGFIYNKPVSKKNNSYTQTPYYGGVGLVVLPLHDQAGAESHFQVFMHSRCITDKNYKIIESVNPKTGLPEFKVSPELLTEKYQDEDGTWLEKQVVDKRRRIGAKNLANKTDFLDSLCDYINIKLEEAGLPLLKNYESKKRFAFKQNGVNYGEELKNYFQEFGLEEFNRDQEVSNKKIAEPVSADFDALVKTVMSDEEIAQTSLSDDIKLIQNLRQKEEEEIKEIQEQLRRKLEVHSQLKSAELTKVELAQRVIDLRKEKESNIVLSRQNEELTESILAVTNTNENLKEENAQKHQEILELSDEVIELKDDKAKLEDKNKVLEQDKVKLKEDHEVEVENLNKKHDDFVSETLIEKESVRVAHEGEINDLKHAHKEEIERIDVEHETYVNELVETHKNEKEEMTITFNEHLKSALKTQQEDLLARFKQHLTKTIQETTTKLKDDFDAKFKEQSEENKKVVDGLKETVKEKTREIEGKDLVIVEKDKEISGYHKTLKEIKSEMEAQKQQNKTLVNEVKEFKEEQVKVREVLGIEPDESISDGVKSLVNEFKELYVTIYEKYKISSEDIENPKHTLKSLTNPKPKQ